jgi:leader peptidase (prepilin peptidase)/N-methyltransferase
VEAPRRAASLARRLAAVVAVTPLLRGAAFVHAVPAGESWRTACPHCGAGVGLSGAGLRALLPPGRCGTCRRRAGPPPYTVEVLAAGAAAALVWWALADRRSGWEVAAYAWWAALAVVLTLVDMAVHRLPDRLTLAAVGGFLLLTGPVALAGRPDAWLRAVLAAVAVGGVLTLLVLLRPGGLGFGDAKLGLAVGAAAGWVGWGAVLGAVVAASLGAALYGIALLVTRRATWASHIPFGPFLLAGTALAVLLPG